MPFSIRYRVLLTTVCTMLGLAAWGQVAPAPKIQPLSSLDVAVTYNASLDNNVPGRNFWMQGGSVQVHGQFWRGLGVVGDVSGLHTGNINGDGVALDMVTVTFGPRYTWQLPRRRFAVYGQVLGGEANAFHSVFPQIGGSIDSASSVGRGAGEGTAPPPAIIPG